jgi:hypothetical protein
MGGHIVTGSHGFFHLLAACPAALFHFPIGELISNDISDWFF